MNKHILYLASGSSRRFGENKLLYPYQGKPLFLWGLEMLWNLTKDREDCFLTVVSRYGAIQSAAKERGICWVDSPESERGAAYTIQAGIRGLGQVEPEDYLLFVAADQPHLRAVSAERLLALAEEGVECASLCYGEQPGNPALFSARLLPELLALEGDSGGRAVLRNHKCAFVQAQVPEELSDIDTKEDIR